MDILGVRRRSRGAGEDDVAWAQREELAAIDDEFPRAEKQVVSRGALPLDAVNVE